MGWYRGIFTFGRRSLMDLYEESKKDYRFTPCNQDKANSTVVSFIRSDQVKIDRRLFSACRATYQRYRAYCKQQQLTAVSSWQFKHNMELLGFAYQKHHRFYAGYHSNKVTTAFANIGLLPIPDTSVIGG